VHRRDLYHRIVGTVYVRRGLFRRDVGLEMLKKGLATTYEAKKGGDFGGLQDVYDKAMAKAKKKRKGMWSTKKSEFESPREYKRRMSGQNGENSGG
jgi:endonuclease YncB( thermonuclease family)